MKRLLVAASVFAAACGGGSDEPASTSPAANAAAAAESNPDPLVVTSDDGALTLEIPAGAIPAGTVITVAPNAGVSGEMSDLGDVLGAYELDPDGLAFDRPATVTFDVPASGDRADGTPIVVGLLESGGAIEPLRSQHLRRDDAGLQLTGTLDHFSTVAFFDGLVMATMTPNAQTVEVGKFFEALVRLSGDGFVAEAVRLTFVDWSVGPGLKLLSETGSTPAEWSKAQIECQQVGKSDTSVAIQIGIPPRTTELSEASALGAVLLAIADDPYAATLTEPVECWSSDEPPPDTVSVSGSAAEEPDDAAADDPPDESFAPSDDDRSSFFIDDPLGDLVTLSGAPAAPGTLPDEIDLTRFGYEGSLWSMSLAGRCDDACLAEMHVASCQQVVYDAEGRVTATAILQKNDEGGFDQRTNGDPAYVLKDASYTGDACEFDVDLSGLTYECTVGGAIRGSRTDSIDDGAEDLTDTVPCR